MSLALQRLDMFYNYTTQQTLMTYVFALIFCCQLFILIKLVKGILIFCTLHLLIVKNNDYSDYIKHFKQYDIFIIGL
jgi:hypothetical protein